MPLEPCRECRKDISTEAEACPHCGIRIRTPASGPGVGKIAAGTFAGVAGCAIIPVVLGGVAFLWIALVMLQACAQVLGP